MARPSFRGARIRVRVPATTANLGPGFDSAGLALDIYDDVVVRITDGGLTVDVAGEGEDAVRRDAKNLVVKTIREAFDRMGGQPHGLEVLCANRIPHGRGLGSSAAAIVAGITAARALVLEPFDAAAALQLATELEGHPDNVAACILGGFTVAWKDADGTTHAAGLPVDAVIRPVVFVPSAQQSTHRARGLIPDTIPHADAAANSARAQLLTAALNGRAELLMAATEDRLHQPYRLPAQPSSAALLGKLRGTGIAAVLSGSGPSVLVLASSQTQVDQATAMAGRYHVAHVVNVARTGATAEIMPS